MPLPEPKIGDIVAEAVYHELTKLYMFTAKIEILKHVITFSTGRYVLFIIEFNDDAIRLWNQENWEARFQPAPFATIAYEDPRMLEQIIKAIKDEYQVSPHSCFMKQ